MNQLSAVTSPKIPIALKASEFVDFVGHPSLILRVAV